LIHQNQASDSEKENFTKVFDSVKTLAVSVADSQLPATHRKSVRKIIDSANLIIEDLPAKKRSLELIVQHEQQRRDNEMAKYQAGSPEILKALVIGSYLDVVTFKMGTEVAKKSLMPLAASAKASEDQEKSYTELIKLSKTSDLVFNFFKVGVTDASNRLNNKILISTFSVKNPDYGVGIVAHELGHLVFNFIEKNKLLEKVDSVGCVNSRNKYKSSAALDKNQFLNEDWSDNFANRIVHFIANSSSENRYYGKNFACALLEHDSDKQFAINKLEPNKDDVHSSGLSRLIMNAADRGASTANCEQLAPNMPQCM
jgi:hypothetical protein